MSFEGIGQAVVLFDLWPENAEWFIVGGPADGDEGQVIKRRFGNGLKCLAIEPNPDYCQYQRGFHFPGEVVECALWDEDKVNLGLALPPDATWRSAITVPTPIGNDRLCIGRTLDSLSLEYGPFTNSVLWLDIEYSEMRALKGAECVLDSVLLANIETDLHRVGSLVLFMERHSLQYVRSWNHREYDKGMDVIFKRKS